MSPWCHHAVQRVEGIILMTIVVMFFVELMVMRSSRFDGANEARELQVTGASNRVVADPKPHIPGDNHLGHSRDHRDLELAKAGDISAEFGIIFHSVFIGLTPSVAGPDFTTLYIVLVFHQTFEGLGLGSRLATLPWPESKRRTPYLLGSGYAVSTRIAIAIGLGVRNTYPPTGRTTLIVNGVFDSISAGILIYTALLEPMAHEFMFSSSMRRASIRTVLSAFFLLCLGAALMALLGKWA